MSRSRTCKTKSSTERWTHRTRKKRSHVKRSQWRRRRKQQKKTITAAERKKARDARRAAKKAVNDAIAGARAEIWAMAERLFHEFQVYSVRWFYEMLIVSARKTSTEREINRWNAFLYMKKKERDESDSGAPVLKAHQLSTKFREEWKAMTKEEQIAATEDAMKELREMREMRKFSLQNVPIAAFHDSQAVLEHLEEELDALAMRTEMEFIIFGARTNMSHYNKPYLYTTSQRVEDYFQMKCGMTVAQFAKGLECYCLAGVDGALKNAHDEVNEMKARAADIILEKLQEAALPDPVKKMHYKEFEQQITDRYGIILENWPLGNFCAPGSLSRPELTVLINSWVNKSTTFRRLSPEELNAWRKKRNMPNASSSSAMALTPDAPLHAPDASSSVTTLSPDTPAHAPDASSSTSSTSLSPTPVSGAATATSTTMADPAATMTSRSTSSETSSPSTSPSTSNASTTGAAGPATSVFAVTSNVLVEKKARKKRSDAGTKRGPNARSKKKNADGHDVSTPSSR